MQRPQNIQQLASAIDRLATYGGARVPEDAVAYLQNVGVAVVSDQSQWMWPTRQFLRDALPASDSSDLLRRVVVRDPRYRLHIDLLMCRVIHAIAVSERWKRLEELLFGQCQSLAPRLSQLLTWLSIKLNKPIREITAFNLQQSIIDNSDSAFSSWDEALWGNSHGPTDLFPLLLDLYVPLSSQPCHVPDNAEINHLMLSSLIDAAKQGEGLILTSNEAKDLQQLQDYGLPIRVELRPNHSICAYMVGRIELLTDEFDTIGELEDIPAGLTTAAKRSCIIRPSSDRPHWSIQDWSAEGIFASTCVNHDAIRWPLESLADTPSWLQLPGSDLISTAAKRRKDSPDADVALQQIAAHPLYGFILQIFLMEALDRELGEETLVFALPQNRKLETVEDWADTKIFYRPRDESVENSGTERDGSLMLGPLDEVVPIIGRLVGIEGIATPYKSDVLPWSRAVYLMSTAGIVDGRPHSWSLTITSFILDRLHSGSLMKDVIRGGHEFRHKMHQGLSELWKEKMASTQEEQIQT